jgi:hypothetical protein
VASERLTQHADRLQDLVRDNGAQVEAIGRVSTTALENMDRLRDDLPVISTRRATSPARSATPARWPGPARGARRGFNRLNQFGEAAAAGRLRARSTRRLAVRGAGSSSRHTGSRFAALAERSAVPRRTRRPRGRALPRSAARRRAARGLASRRSSSSGRRGGDRGLRAPARCATRAPRLPTLRTGERRPEAVRGSVPTRRADDEAIRRYPEVDQARWRPPQAVQAPRRGSAAIGMLERADAFQRSLDAAMPRHRARGGGSRGNRRAPCRVRCAVAERSRSTSRMSRASPSAATASPAAHRAQRRDGPALRAGPHAQEACPGPPGLGACRKPALIERAASRSPG